MMHIKKYLTLSTALVLSACGGGGGGSETSPTGDSSGAAASGFEYLSQHCPNTTGSPVLSMSKCLNGEFVGTSQNTQQACTMTYAFKDIDGVQSITQTIHIDGLKTTLDRSVKPDKSYFYYAKQNAPGMYLHLDNHYDMPATQPEAWVHYKVATLITTGNMAASDSSHIDVNIDNGQKTYRCNLTGFTPAQ